MAFDAFLIRQWHYTRLGFKLAHFGVGARSIAVIALLGLLIQLKGHSRWRDLAVGVRIRVGDTVFPLRLAARTELEVMREIFIEREYWMPRSDRRMTIVDLGAHVGLASVYMSTRFPNARIIAIEADPRLISRLRSNVSGIAERVIHGAISAQPGTRPLYRSDDTWSNSVNRVHEWQAPVSVPAVTLRDVMDETETERIDLLKIDVEGAEWEVFADGVPDYVDAVIGEAHRVGDREPRELLARIEESMCVSVRRGDGDRIAFFAERCEGECSCRIGESAGGELHSR